MLVRTLPLVLLFAIAPAFAQDVPATKKAGQKQALDNIVAPCPSGSEAAIPDNTVQPAGSKPGGKVSVKDMTGPMAARTGSGQGTGKVNVQDIRMRTTAPGGTPPAQNCPLPRP
ncbi:MAG: hypothetical protein V4808_13995 [Pseudomonadota bacterium]